AAGAVLQRELLREHLAEASRDPLENRFVQGFFAVEVAVDDQPADARRGGDVIHRRGCETPFRKSRRGRVQDRFAAVGVTRHRSQALYKVYTSVYTLTA